MIITETVTINDKTFTHNYSDAGMKIERDGIQYDEAYDLAETGRTYTETDIPVEGEEESAKETLSLLEAAL